MINPSRLVGDRKTGGKVVGQTISHYKVTDKLDERGPNYARASLGGLVSRSLINIMLEVFK